MKLRHDMLTHGVNIVCARNEGEIAGLAVAWATQLATDRVLVCVGSQSHTRDLILASGAFSLNVLHRGQLELARLFGTQSSRSVDKFAGVAHHTGPTGSPLLDDCIRTLDCEVDAVHDDGGHKLIIGKVVEVEPQNPGATPLLYRQEDY